MVASQLHDRRQASWRPNPSVINEILDGRLFYNDVLFRAVPSIVGKANSLFSLAEDRGLSEALKRIDIGKSAETPKNDLSNDGYAYGG